MNNRWALALPATREPKSASERERVTNIGTACQQMSVCSIRRGFPRLLTSRLVSESLANSALVLEVDVPAFGLASAVLEVEGEDGVALLDGVLLVGVAGESNGNSVKGCGGRELV